MRAVVFLLFVFVAAQQAHSAYFRDVAALQSLMKQWNNNTSPNWTQQDDTCSGKWEGVTCEDSRVITLSLSSMGLSGTLSDDISLLSQLQSLDLSYNSGLGGTLTPYIGNLKQLINLVLTGCSFSGNIPQELGGLPRLTFLALNANDFSGGIPASLGNLSSLYWLDVSENLLNGSIPISTDKSPGLDLLVKTRHFHFNRNQLSGSIPEKLFSSKMNLIHIRFEENEFTGPIPASIGLVESLEVIRLDRNSFTGAVPLTFNNLTNVTVLNLAYNLLTGPLPNLSGMNNLQYLDLSKIMFDPSETPAWFSSLQYLNTLEMQSGRIYGQISPKLFRLPMLQHVNLYNNYLNGTLDMGSNIGSQLQMVNLQANSISFLLLDDNYRGSLMLEGNPVCIAQYSNTTYCRTPQTSTTYSTSLAKCSSNSCPSDQSLEPGSCYCSYPYIGQLIFRAPYFQDLTNNTRFQQLEKSLWTQFILSQGSVSISNIFFTDDSYLQLQIKLFPSTGMYFNRSEISRIGYQLNNQTFRPTPDFGPYFFIASKYSFQVNDSGSEVVSGDHGRSSFSKLKVSGVALGSVLALTGLIFVVIYTFKQAKINIIAATSPPQFKETKCFSFDELMKSTNNFSDVNEIGSGGYGKVYKGTLPYGRMIAVKRLRQGSMQGGIEFRTEIELLSRVHHRNLVELVGFCCEKGEQMLVYELIPNGTLRESLAGSGKVQLDWNRRLEIALGSARGLAYLHEHANPPIIHRDVKSTNILLDENLNAKVADFGLSKLVSDIQKGHVSTEVKGTLGYLDPEYYMTQQLTEKSDVYSFGVVMLELLTAKKPIEHGKNTVREFRTVMERDDGELCSLNEMMGDDGELCSLNEMMDPTIRNEINLTELRRFIHVVMQCVGESAAKRPTMGAVIKEIELMLYEFQEAE